MNPNQEPDQNEELAILLAARDVTLSDGQVVTVREYGGFMEGLRVDALAAPVLDELHTLFSGLNSGSDFHLTALSAVFGKHPDIMTSLLAMACDKPVDWVQSLNDQDGQLVLMTWWSANSRFFTRRLVTEGLTRAAVNKAQATGAASLAD